ncbi:MAG: hypothetical protein Ct9H300mP27_07780 [Chloroflexota bacterium]|nr:MAG: hypothetical protein Ct9H300mP27_07780 [Chloroflexota bacterium]
MQYTSKFGIYVKFERREAVRINSPYWLPEEPDWVFLTPGGQLHVATNS